MIEKRTVFILGAGASCPYGFPTARGLREQILSSFKDRYIEFLGGSSGEVQVARMGNGYPNLSDTERFLEYFDLSGTESVDLFLSRNAQFEKIGKMAICLSILHAEKDSVFREQVKKREHDWYFYLYNRLTQEAIGREAHRAFGENPVAFVTFNYDRSLESFLFDSLLHSFEGMYQDTAREELDRTPVIHVYGKPGRLPWERSDEQEVLPYGKHIDSLSFINLLGIIDNIYVAHGQRANPNLERAHRTIREAEHVFFLGFGYAKENLEAVGIPDALSSGQRLYGTAMGVPNVTKVISALRSGLRDAEAFAILKIDPDADCLKLLHQYL